MENQISNTLNVSFITLDQALTIVLLLLVIFYMIHSAIVAYHWLTYSTNRAQAFIAVVIHTGVGGFLLLAMGAIILF